MKVHLTQSVPCISKKLQNPHKTHNISLVPSLEDHNGIQPDKRHTVCQKTSWAQMASFKEDEHHVRTAKGLEEACELAKTDFDFFARIDCVQGFRKRK